MAEEEDKQEAKFDFTAEGESLGYISFFPAYRLIRQRVLSNWVWIFTVIFRKLFSVSEFFGCSRCAPTYLPRVPP